MERSSESASIQSEGTYSMPPETSPQSSTHPSGDTFERVESKFLFSKELHSQLITLLEKNLQPSYPIPGTTFTEIESIYFDSPRFDFIHDHFQKISPRYKLRIRRYAPNGVWDPLNPSYVEIKAKANGITKKQRIAIGNRQRMKLVTGNTLIVSPDLVQLNSDMNFSKLARRVTLINELFRVYDLVPQVRNVYHRTAYEKDGIRATIDSQIRYVSLSEVSEEASEGLLNASFWPRAFELSNKFSNDANVVVEIKHTGMIPGWFLDFVNQNGVVQSSFSKYCWATAQHVGSLRK